MQWFRFYHDALDDPKVQMLDPALFKHWVNILCIASRENHRGTLPVTLQLAFQLRVDVATCNDIVAELMHRGLIDKREDGRLEPHNWPVRQPKSDDGAVRVREHRAKKAPDTVTRNEPVTLHVTPPDTETETDIEKKATRASARSRAVVIDELFETVAVECYAPGHDYHALTLTRTERGRVNDACAELREVNVTPDEVRAIAAEYRSRSPGFALTPQTITKKVTAFRNRTPIQIDGGRRSEERVAPDGSRYHVYR